MELKLVYVDKKESPNLEWKFKNGGQRISNEIF